ncbi:MAG: LCP family protein, partial [Chloroflexota bacterium]|nr:LCP family protein [Chloroflexota bacterium]
ILSAAQEDPTLYPDGPMATFVGQISYLLGVDIDYYASVDIPGFERLVDSVGGVDVVVREPITDPTIPFFMDVGPHHLDGETAVKFVRSRRGGGSNEDRSIRQQHVLLALRQKLSDPQMLPRLPEVLDAVAATVRTSLPPGQLGETLALARQASGASVSQMFLGPDEWATELTPDDTALDYAIELRLDRVAELSQDLWGDASYYSDPAYYQQLLAAAAP